jgi:hypothetical protein
MPRKPRITAIPVEQEEQVPTVQVVDSLAHVSDASKSQRDADEKTDAEQMTDIIKEVKEEPKEVIPDAPVVTKPKAKRVSRAKPKEEPQQEEPQQEEPKDEPKGEEKVACSDCGKQMSAKTLKYSHGPNCSSKKQKKEDGLYPRGRKPKGPKGRRSACHTKGSHHRGID